MKNVVFSLFAGRHQRVNKSFLIGLLEMYLGLLTFYFGRPLGSQNIVSGSSLVLAAFWRRRGLLSETLAKMCKIWRNYPSKNMYKKSNWSSSSMLKHPWSIWEISKSTVFFNCSS